MIFVTVGTHEQPFDRLVSEIDRLVEQAFITEEVIIQTGFCTYKPKYCTYSRLYPYEQMVDFNQRARIVITHGGPSSFIMPLQMGKIPIVVPRQKSFEEHVDDHQLSFVRYVETHQKNIIVVEDIADLKTVIENYDTLTRAMSASLGSNNQQFNEKLEKLVNRLF